MELTKKERLFLYNQYEILRLINSDDEYLAKRYGQLQEIVQQGYEAEYWKLGHFEEKMGKEEFKFVLDVLRMYRILNNSYGELTESEKNEIDIYDITFHGFDGHVDSLELSYLRFIFEESEKYTEIIGDMKDLDSHHDYRPMYRERLKRLNDLRIESYKNIDLNQIKHVIGK